MKLIEVDLLELIDIFDKLGDDCQFGEVIESLMITEVYPILHHIHLVQQFGRILLQFPIQIHYPFTHFLCRYLIVLFELVLVLLKHLHTPEAQRRSKDHDQINQPFGLYFFTVVFGSDLYPIFPEVLLKQSEDSEGVVLIDVVGFELIQHNKHEQLKEDLLAKEDVGEPEEDVIWA